MGHAFGIVGLPNAGKSTLFNALTAAGAAVAAYPFCTLEPNRGVVPVPDSRLDRLAGVYCSQKVTPTTLEFVDIAGLVQGAARGEGLGNQFLHHIREVDAILHVVRCFRDPQISHVFAEVDPVRDVEVIETELILADVQTVERHLGRLARRVKSGDPRIRREWDFLQGLREHLLRGERPQGLAQSEEEARWLQDCHLLTVKPVLYVANVDEAGLRGEDPARKALEDLGRARGIPVLVICGRLEAEIQELPPEERQVFLEDLGLREPGLHRLIREAYRLLDLVTFFTCNEREVRAWTVSAGTRAPKAAGRIHSDMERGFIRVEVTRFEDLDRLGSPQVVREQGLLRIEGRDYVVQEGDILYFRFQPTTS